jgi:hypothetical protein
LDTKLSRKLVGSCLWPLALLVMVAGLGWPPSASAATPTLNITDTSFGGLEEGQWAFATVGQLVQVRLVDDNLDVTLPLRVNMKKDKGSSRVLGAQVEGEAKSSLFIEWSQNHTRAVLILTSRDVGYVITLRPGQPVDIQKQPVGKLICGGSEASAGIPRDPAMAFQPQPVQSALPIYFSDPAPEFNSNPGARSVILLDFDGHTVSGTYWNSGYNNGYDIIAAPFDADGNTSTFNAYEVDLIKTWFDEVADDFAPFTINVTTSEAVYQAANAYSRIRVIITPTNYFFPGYGGVAFYHAFSWGDDTPVWTWNTTLESNGETNSHEVGHAVGLSHDGGPLGFAAPTYYGGYEVGDLMHWSPIMGAYFDRGVKHWSRGQYPEANNTEDDLAIMTGQIGNGYGFTFRNDDYGNDAASASPLAVVGSEVISGRAFARVEMKGVVAQASDVDVFNFVPNASGPVSFSFRAAISDTPSFGSRLIGNLDIEATVFDEAGNILGISNNPLTLDTSLNVNVEAGKLYFVKVEGVGKGDPNGFGIPDYASLGSYTISGHIPAEDASQSVTSIVARRGAITVDDVLEPAWNVEAHKLTTLLGRVDSERDASGSWRAVWDENKLYVAVEVQDEQMILDSPNAWDDDSVEVYLDIGGKAASSYSSTDYQYVVRAQDGAVSIGARSASAMPGIETSTTSIRGGYRIEMAIPWNRSQGFAPQEGGLLGIDVHVNDDDDGGSRDAKLSWKGQQDTAWSDPSTFAPAILRSAIDAVVRRAPAAPIIDGQADQMWDGVTRQFLDKVLLGTSSQGAAFWRALSDDQALYVTVDVVDEALVADSTHPWEDDSVEIFLDVAGNGGSAYQADDVQLVFRWGDADPYLGVNSADVDPNGVQFHMAKTGHGYRLEAAISWSALALRPNVGDLFGIDVHVNDDDNGGARDGKRAWAATSDDTWQWPHMMGKAQQQSVVGLSTAVIPLIEDEPVVDGQHGDWSDALWRPIDRVILGQTDGPRDNQAAWQARATGRGLYVAVRVMDDLAINDSVYPWEDDSIEVYLDGDGTRGATYDGVNDAQWVVRVRDDVVHGGVNSVGSDGVIMSQQHIRIWGVGNLTTMEMFIPWRNLRPVLGDGERLGIDVHVNDDDNGGNRDGKLSWFGATDNAWSRPDAFAVAALKI